MTPTPNPTAEQIVAEAMVNAGAPLMHSRIEEAVCGALRAHGLLSEGAPSEESRDLLALAKHLHSRYGRNQPVEWDAMPGHLQNGWLIEAENIPSAGVAPQEPSEAEKKLEEIRRYAEDRAAHCGHPILNIVGSGRIASDLFEILGVDWPEGDEDE